MSRSRRSVLKQLIGGASIASAAPGFSLLRHDPRHRENGRSRPARQLFEIQVIDERTGRGVPLFELRTTGDQRFITDSADRVAIGEPGLMGQEVFFHVKSHGYRHSAGSFGYEGRQISVRPGEQATIAIERKNIAERLYRVTGRGIYRDSVMLGREVPLREPVLNHQITGQDSVQALAHNDRIHWFWGDTDRLGDPLGNFQTTGAVSPLPGVGGLPPADGVNLNYFTGEDGLVRPMAPLPTDAGNIMWIDGVISVPDADGQAYLVARYSHRAGLDKELDEGLLVFDDEHQQFELLETNLTLGPSWSNARGHATATQYEDGGLSYWLFARPWPVVRVRNEVAAVRRPEVYEAFTCLEPGASVAGTDTCVERDSRGSVVWAWKCGVEPCKA